MKTILGPLFAFVMIVSGAFLSNATSSNNPFSAQAQPRRLTAQQRTSNRNLPSNFRNRRNKDSNLGRQQGNRIYDPVEHRQNRASKTAQNSKEPAYRRGSGLPTGRIKQRPGVNQTSNPIAGRNTGGYDTGGGGGVGGRNARRNRGGRNSRIADFTEWNRGSRISPRLHKPIVKNNTVKNLNPRQQR